MKIITAEDVRPDICQFLQGWFNKAKARQEAKGKTFNLTFGEFLTLWGKRRLTKLAEWKDKGTLYVNCRRPTPSDPNSYGYVLAPISFAASRETVYDATTLQICTRAKALEDCKMKKGDKHSEESKARISASTKGVEKKPEHRAKISKSMKGKNTGPMDNAGKTARSIAAKAYWDRVRAEKAAKEAANRLDGEV